MVRSMQADRSHLEAIAAEYGDQIEIVKLNIDQNPTTAAKYGVMSIPTLNVYQGGEVVQTIVGAKSKAALERNYPIYPRVAISIS
jgi:thioredoxin 1